MKSRCDLVDMFWPEFLTDTQFTDLLVAIAHALGRMTKSKLPAPDTTSTNSFSKNTKGVTVLITTDKPKKGTNRDGWNDQMKIRELKRRLRIIMQNLSYAYGGIDPDKIEPALNNLLHFKRTSTTATGDGQELYNHSKIVVVDGRVMYVGSDNAYPSYNEEHGVWIEDRKTINSWLSFFENFWTICANPTGDDIEPQK